MRSGTDSGVRSVVAMPSSIRLAPSAARALAALRSVSIETRSFHLERPGVGSATMRVVSAAGVNQVWKVTLLLAGGQWKLAETIAAGQ